MRTTLDLELKHLDELVRESRAAGRNAFLNNLIATEHRKLMLKRLINRFGTQPPNHIERDDEGDRIVVHG